MIKKLLIANRGDVQRRIIHSAHKLGIKCVILHEQAQKQNHQQRSYVPDNLPRYLQPYDVECATLSERLELSQVYLNISFWLDLAKHHDCDGIHPGWGFLSEDPASAQAVHDAGLIWVGATSKMMLPKAAAKQLAESCGVMAAKGTEALRLPQEKAKLQAAASTIGYPLMVKSVSGGGGRSLCKASSAAELEDALAKSSREGERYFGDGRILLEAYYPKARHIEWQLLCDTEGHIVSLGSRDGSVQRNYQKFLEECPAYGLDQYQNPQGNLLADELESSAISLAKALGYQGALTVEFLVFPISEKHHDWVFMEMNTRLQVEHTVTEEVWGIDLVEWQLRVAVGESVSSLTSLTPRGHSIQARLCSEMPSKNFMPSSGPVFLFLPRHQILAELPPQHLQSSVRYETAVESGSEVLSQFDSLMCKVIAWGTSRALAIRRLHSTLADLVLVGPASNREFLMTLLSSPQLTDGEVDTSFVSTHRGHLADLASTRSKLARQWLNQICDELGTIESSSQEQHLSPSDKIAEVFSTNHHHHQSLPYKIRNLPGIEGRISAGDSSIAYKAIPARSWLAGYPHNLPPQTSGKLDFVLFVMPESHEPIIMAVMEDGYGASRQLGTITQTTSVDNQAKTLHDTPTSGVLSITSPVAGRVLKLAASSTPLSSRSSCVTIESMKMEISITPSEFLPSQAADSWWIVDKTFVRPDDTVTSHQLLMVIKPQQPSS